MFPALVYRKKPWEIPTNPRDLSYIRKAWYNLSKHPCEILFYQSEPQGSPFTGPAKQQACYSF